MLGWLFPHIISYFNNYCTEQHLLVAAYQYITVLQELKKKRIVSTILQICIKLKKKKKFTSCLSLSMYISIYVSYISCIKLLIMILVLIKIVKTMKHHMVKTTNTT